MKPGEASAAGGEVGGVELFFEFGVGFEHSGGEGLEGVVGEVLFLLENGVQEAPFEGGIGAFRFEEVHDEFAGGLGDGDEDASGGEAAGFADGAGVH